MSKSEMEASSREESPVLWARLAGTLWLLCILTGVAGFIAAGPLIVANDAAVTAGNILAKESLFRLGFVANLTSGLSYVGVTALLYYVLRPVSRNLSLLAAFFGLAGVAIGGISWVSNLAPLILLHGDQYLSAFTTSQLQAMSLFALKLQTQVFFIGMVFFGIQVILIGCLVTRSTFLPRILGILLALGGTCYVIASFASFLLPLGTRLVMFVMPVALIGEGSLTVWLLVKGVNRQRWKQQAGTALEYRT